MSDDGDIEQLLRASIEKQMYQIYRPNVYEKRLTASEYAGYKWCPSQMQREGALAHWARITVRAARAMKATSWRLLDHLGHTLLEGRVT